MIIAMRKHKPSIPSLRPSLLLPVLLLAAGGFAVGEEGIDDATLSAGSFTIRRFDRQAFSEPAGVLDARQRQLFMAGRSVFRRQWASVNSLNGDWGLGPTFIADRCSACHVNAGRGSPPEPGEQMLSMLVRLSLPGEGEHGAPRPHPNYGDQLQNRSLDGSNVDLAYAGSPMPRWIAAMRLWGSTTSTLITIRNLSRTASTAWKSTPPSPSEESM